MILPLSSRITALIVFAMSNICFMNVVKVPEEDRGCFWTSILNLKKAEVC